MAPIRRSRARTLSDIHKKDKWERIQTKIKKKLNFKDRSKKQQIKEMKNALRFGKHVNPKINIFVNIPRIKTEDVTIEQILTEDVTAISDIVGKEEMGEEDEQSRCIDDGPPAPITKRCKDEEFDDHDEGNRMVLGLRQKFLRLDKLFLEIADRIDAFDDDCPSFDVVQGMTMNKF